MLLFERLVGFIVVGVLLWQFLIPAIFGTPTFPMFRRKKTEDELLAEIEEARRQKVVEGLEHELEELQKKEKENGK